MARLLVLLAAGLVLLSLAPAAHAASRTAIIRDCEDDSRLSGTYTVGELRDARNNLPSDKDAYSDCRDVLGAALAAAASRGRDPSGTSGSGAGNALEGGSGAPSGGASGAPAAAPAPALDLPPGAAPLEPTGPELETLAEARAKPPQGETTVPGVRAVAGDAATATVPTSLAVVLALLGLTILLAAAPSVRRRVVGRRAG